MSVAVATAELRPAPSPWRIIWLAAVLATVALYLLSDHLPWADTYPKDWQLPFAAWVTIAMRWVIDTFFDVTRAFTAVLNVPLQIAFALLERGFTIGEGEAAIAVPPLSWVGVSATVAIIGYAYGGWRLA